MESSLEPRHSDPGEHNWQKPPLLSLLSTAPAHRCASERQRGCPGFECQCTWLVLAQSCGGGGGKGDLCILEDPLISQKLTHRRVRNASPYMKG